jgi:branched-chain amino acid transport system permease protein
MSPYIQTIIFGLTLGGLYALMASGLTLVFGVMRIVNLAHSVFILMAAYISYTLFQGPEIAILGQHIVTLPSIDPILSILINFPVMFLFGVVVYRLILGREVENPRYREITVLLTFAIALIAEGVLGEVFTGTNRSTRPEYTTQVYFVRDYLGFLFPDTRIFIPKAQFYAAMMSLAIITGTWAFLQYSRMGYAIRATSQNRAAAQVVGVNVQTVSTFTFGLGTAMAGAAGALFSFIIPFFPSSHWEFIALMLSLIVLGGMGKLLGAVVGAFLLAVTAALVSKEFGPTWSPLTFYLSLFIILLVRPQGLFGKKLEMV